MEMGKELKSVMSRQKRHAHFAKYTASLLLIVCLCILLGGCSRITNLITGQLSDLDSVSLKYDDAEKYTAGGATLEAQITGLEVEWIAGEVQVVYHDGDGISFEEKVTGDLPKDEDEEAVQLHYLVEDGTLHIKYAKSGAHHMGNTSKDLVVSLPKSCRLNELEFDGVSANLSVDGIAVRKASCDTVSGQIDLDVDGNLEKLDVDSVSGNITVYLPEGTPFEVEMDSVSGSFDSDFDVKRDSDGERFWFGDGGGKYEFDTVSGNLTILKK